MDLLFPGKTTKSTHYSMLKGDYPVVSPATMKLDCGLLETLIDIPSVLSATKNTSVILYVNELYKQSDLRTVLVKESALDNIIKCSLQIGGQEIVGLDINMIKDLCDKHTMKNNEVFVDLFSKFIEQIPVKTCYYHTVCLCFEYDKCNFKVSSTKKLVFKYENYDEDYAADFGYSPDAYEEVETLVYQGMTPELKFVPLVGASKNMISFMTKNSNIVSPFDISLSKYIFFNDTTEDTDISINVDETSLLIKKQDLNRLPQCKKYMWKVPHENNHEFVRVQGEKLISSVPIAFSLHANKLRVTDGLAGKVFAN